MGQLEEIKHCGRLLGHLLQDEVTLALPLRIQRVFHPGASEPTPSLRVGGQSENGLRIFTLLHSYVPSIFGAPFTATSASAPVNVMPVIVAPTW